jgi:hypothetical protein
MNDRRTTRRSRPHDGRAQAISTFTDDPTLWSLENRSVEAPVAARART